MSEEEAKRDTAPRSLAEVSHLFFSRTDDQATAPSERPRESREATRAVRPAGGGEAARTTAFAFVTGGEDAPGKSTVAVNMARALVPHGRTALLDADRRVPNARFYLRAPSWNYLSPLTGGGSRVAEFETDDGIIVADWSARDSQADGIPGGAAGMRLVGSDGLSHPVDFAVIDAPASRHGLFALLEGRRICPVLVAGPGRRGFESAFAALKGLCASLEGREVHLVVNCAPDPGYAAAYHAKMREAAQRLLLLDIGYLGGVEFQPGMGSLQRERGAILSARPDALAALSLRRIADRVRAMLSGGPFDGAPEGESSHSGTEWLVG
jgi:MinD-like ATPase involved in chromosome partitioning or flagellar assembly